MPEEVAIDELLEWGLIEDSEEYFELDDNDEPNHDYPKFDYTDYRDKYLETRLNDINDVVDYFLRELGYDDIQEYMDIDKLVEYIIDEDGFAKFITGYDNEQREQRVDGTIYYIYRSQ